MLDLKSTDTDEKDISLKVEKSKLFIKLAIDEKEINYAVIHLTRLQSIELIKYIQKLEEQSKHSGGRPRKYNEKQEQKKNYPIRMFPSTKESFIKTHREYMQEVSIDADQDKIIQLGMELINKHILKNHA